MNEFDNSTKNKLLEKILNSSEFLNSHIYGKYLTYLVDSSLEDKNLKETTIAIEFFEKDVSFNPAEDTIVRSHTYNLRKKLETYYFTEGKEDKYKIIIPKGHYHAEIVPNENNYYTKLFYLKRISQNYPFIIIAFLVICVVILALQYISIKKELNAHHLIDGDDYIWREYLKSKIPILVVPGDHFMFDIYSEKYKREFSVRDVTINSKEDLDKFRTKYSDEQIHQTPEPYFPFHSIWSLPPVYSILTSFNQFPILRKSSSITPQMLGEYNIIFIGSIKTLYALKHTLTKSHFNYHIAPHKVTYTPPDGENVQEYSTNLHSTGPNEDLVLVLKLPGPSENIIFIIASYHSLGAPEIAKFLVTPAERDSLDKRLIRADRSYPKYFEILFRVTGIDKTAYNLEILICNEIKVD